MSSPVEQVWDDIISEIDALNLFDVQKRRVPIKQQDKQNRQVITVCLLSDDAKPLSFNEQELVYTFQVVVIDPTWGRNRLYQDAEVTAVEHRRSIWEHFRGLTSLTNVSTVFDINMKLGYPLDTSAVSAEHLDKAELHIMVHNLEQRATF